jgi:hypothetical protein
MLGGVADMVSQVVVWVRVVARSSSRVVGAAFGVVSGLMLEILPRNSLP